MLHSTVTFVEWGLQETKEFVPPAPPLMFSVPADVFYPFKLSAAHALKPTFGETFLHAFTSYACSIAKLYSPLLPTSVFSQPRFIRPDLAAVSRGKPGFDLFWLGVMHDVVSKLKIREYA